MGRKYITRNEDQLKADFILLEQGEETLRVDLKDRGITGLDAHVYLNNVKNVRDNPSLVGDRE